MIISDISLLTFILILQILFGSHSYEYCKYEKRLCGALKHIACHPEQIKPTGKLMTVYTNTKSFRDHILYWHNFYRNKVSCGHIEGLNGSLPAAIRMRELQWDYELAYISRIHAMRCNSVHDECRKTRRILTSGQNLAHQTETAAALLDAMESVKSWFLEHKAVNTFMLDGNWTDEDAGHFALLLNDEVTRVGCTMTRCEVKKNLETFLTCNYDYENFVEETIYAIGKKPASDCGSVGVEKSKKFSCLCGPARYHSFFFF